LEKIRRSYLKNALGILTGGVVTQEELGSLVEETNSDEEFVARALEEEGMSIREPLVSCPKRGLLKPHSICPFVLRCDNVKSEARNPKW
jgi:hypothetical protein